jgi:hypothetical protein
MVDHVLTTSQPGAMVLRLENGAVLPTEAVPVSAGPLGLGNWVQYMGLTGSGLTRQPVPGTQTAPSSTCIFAAVLETLNTGIYQLSVNVDFSDNTDADVVGLKVVGGSLLGPGVLTCLGPGGFVAAGESGSGVVYATSGLVGGDQAGGAGLLIDGTAINTLAVIPYPFTSTGVTIPTGAGGGGFATQHWSWTGLVSFGAKVKTPFPVGEKAFFGVLLDSSGGKVVTVGSAGLMLVEWPSG